MRAVVIPPSTTAPSISRIVKAMHGSRKDFDAHDPLWNHLSSTALLKDFIIFLCLFGAVLKPYTYVFDPFGDMPDIHFCSKPIKKQGR